MKRTRPDISQYKDLLSSVELALFRSQIGLALEVSRKTLRNVDECEKHLDAALYGLFKAVKKYDKGLGSLVGFISKCVKNEVLSMSRSRKNAALFNSSSVDPDTICDTESMDKQDSVEFRLMPRREKIYEMRASGMTFREIGLKFGISRVRAYQIYNWPLNKSILKKRMYL